MIRKIFLLWMFFFVTPLLFAQVDYDLKVMVDTTQMRIGEKIEYTLQFKADSTAQVTFSEQAFFTPFEILEELPIDTLRSQSHYLFTKKYALIQFDSGAYWLPPQKVMVNGFS